MSFRGLFLFIPSASENHFFLLPYFLPMIVLFQIFNIMKGENIMACCTSKCSTKASKKAPKKAVKKVAKKK